jgi:hypothetical protein
MAENKTQRTKASVPDFLAAIPDPQRRKDAKALAALMRQATGEKGAMWGTAIVGYGDCTYEGSGGRMVDWFPVGFSPRKAALVVYLMGGLKADADLLPKLGRHKVGGGCLYLDRFDEVDLQVLTRLIQLSQKRNLARTKGTSAKAKPKKRAR